MSGTQTAPANGSTADLVRRAIDQTQTLIRDEVALAKAELAAKARSAAMGGGLFGGAALLGLYGGGVLVAAAVLLVALVLPAWAAALIVAGALLLLAGLLARAGRARLRRAGPPVPEEAVAGVRADLQAVADAAKDHHR
jgi:Flp pilus assembly protein TadB